MPIDIEWQDEKGRLLARYEGPALTRAVVERADPTSVCLRFIDPYGNAVFNQHQLPTLIQEFESLGSRTRDGQREVIDALVPFLRGACEKVHTYVKFIGD
jgi:hypothetical protein